MSSNIGDGEEEEDHKEAQEEVEVKEGCMDVWPLLAPEVKFPFVFHFDPKAPKKGKGMVVLSADQHLTGQFSNGDKTSSSNISSNINSIDNDSGGFIPAAVSVPASAVGSQKKSLVWSLGSIVTLQLTLSTTCPFEVAVGFPKPLTTTTTTTTTTTDKSLTMDKSTNTSNTKEADGELGGSNKSGFSSGDGGEGSSQRQGAVGGKGQRGKGLGKGSHRIVVPGNGVSTTVTVAGALNVVSQFDLSCFGLLRFVFIR
jgi:hypothetical protein